MEKILNLLELTEEEKTEFIKAAGKNEQIFAVQGIYENGKAVSQEDWETATIIMGIANPGVLKYYPKNCRYLQGRMAGPDAFLKEGLLPENTVIAGCQGAYGQSVAEHMFAMMLALMKLLPQYRDNQFEGKWTDLGKCQTPVGTKVMIFGTGDLGTSFAKLMKPFASAIYGVRRNKQIPAEGIDVMLDFGEADLYLPEMDIVINMAPSGPITNGFMTKERLLSMKKTAIFLNGGRGSFVDSDILAEVLESGHLFGAGIDVTDQEPLNPANPLWRCKNCMLTPHKAGFDKIPVTFRKVAEICLDNMERYLNGKELRNRIR